MGDYRSVCCQLPFIRSIWFHLKGKHKIETVIIDVGCEIDLETPLEKLVDIFENKIKAINRLKEKLNLETRLQFVIDIDINSDSSIPYFGLNKGTINF